MSDLVDKLSALLKNKGFMLATAESCTGGMIAAAITDRAGSSAIFDRGFVTYSNEAKIDMLNVQNDTLMTHGAVSHQTAEQMVVGALNNSNANIAIAVTGIAGPDGGTTEKPLGLVYIGYGLKNGTPTVTKYNFSGSRDDIRTQTVDAALHLLITLLDQPS